MSTVIEDLERIEVLRDQVIDLLVERMGKSDAERQQVLEVLRGMTIAQLRAFVQFTIVGPRESDQANETPDVQVGEQDSSMSENWRWALESRAAGALNAYAGQHVVVSDGKVVAADRDAEVAVQRAVHCTSVPRRDLAVLFIDEPGSEGWLDVG